MRGDGWPQHFRPVAPSPAPRRRSYGTDKGGYLQASRLLLPYLPPPIERAAGSRRRLGGPRMLSGMTSNTRARFEIAIDGSPRAWYRRSRPR